MKQLLLLILISIAALSLAGTTPAIAQQKKDQRPNIVLILADDLGYSDLGCYGGEIQTPHLDSLAAGGIRMSRFYNTSRCCPTRASLLTGVYNHTAGIGEMTAERNTPGYHGRLTNNVVTIAEVLQAAGYHTGMSGKWHVSNTIEQQPAKAQMDWLNHQTVHPYFSPVEQYPVNRGFEKYFGNIWGVVDFFDPFSLVSGTKPVEQVPAGYYHTDAINDTAVAYIKAFAGSEQPFFLYVAQTAPHWPLQALPEDIERYKDSYKSGWDVIRERRYRRMQQLGLIDTATAPLSPRIDNELTWEQNPDTAWDARAMAVHAAMIDRMDQGIGRIIQALRVTGKLDNTLVIFLSDNGASPEDCARYGPGFDRPDKTRNGQRIVYAVNKEVMPGPETTYTSIGRRWANVANTPFRYAKAESYEGGVRTPFIAYWPAGIKARKGSISRQPGHVMDLMATFTDIAGARYPAVYKGQQIVPMQGISLKPVLHNKTMRGHTILCNEHFGARYIRSGQWKMVMRNGDKTWQLYDTEKDETELNDVAAAHPAIVKMLDGEWGKWARSHHVLPKPGK
ncbi:arylsulfatase [Chitinophaga rhizophila]|uniref:Arylsulfatase n=1 Tax=Chitinophaga rhizophila TaxID=2866212 RepID=A0ABS7G8C1_9BACT|nr:arylsulfatase [Chitinophaga rhizophila]MBW8682798.1 arylsulfatase [Chitinophaga rhizophila]